MTVKKSPWGETPRRIYTTLRKNPGLTSVEVHRLLPDLSYAAVQSAVVKMLKRGELQAVGVRSINRTGKRETPCTTYKIKYKGVKVRTKQGKPKPEYEVKPKVKAPKVVDTKPAWNVADIKPEPEGPKTPKAEREVLVLRHLTDIYKAMTLMTDQQDALIAILKDTLLQLDVAERELERERQRRNWWDKIKELF